MSNSRERFIEAVKSGDIVRAREVLESDPAVRAGVNEPWFAFDSPAIACAAGCGNREMVELLLAHGADVNARSSWRAGAWSALHAAISHRHQEIAELLLARGARLDAHSAAGLDRIEALEEILRADPSIASSRGPDGMTPMHFAATPRIADCLIRHGADIDLCDLDHNGTPAEWMVRDRPDVARHLIALGARASVFLRCALGDLDFVRETVTAEPLALTARSTGDAPGGHINLYTGLGIGSTLVETAARFARLEALRFLLDAGGSVTAPGQHDATPLHWAAWQGNAAALELLLDRGAVIDAVDPTFGSTPLGWAAHGSVNSGNAAGQHQLVVERLIARGANIRVAGNRWGAKLSSMGTARIGEILRQRGAE